MNPRRRLMFKNRARAKKAAALEESTQPAEKAQTAEPKVKQKTQQPKADSKPQKKSVSNASKKVAPKVDKKADKKTTKKQCNLINSNTPSLYVGVLFNGLLFMFRRLYECQQTFPQRHKQAQSC